MIKTVKNGNGISDNLTIMVYLIVVSVFDSITSIMGKQPYALHIPRHHGILQATILNYYKQTKYQRIKLNS